MKFTVLAILACIAMSASAVPDVPRLSHANRTTGDDTPVANTAAIGRIKFDPR